MLRRALLAALVVIASSATAVATAALLEFDTLVDAFNSESSGPGFDTGVLDKVDPGGPQTILLLGADKRAAAEFSFFLAIPTMVGAFVYDLYKSRGEMTMDHAGLIAIGFVVSFVTAMIVVKAFLGYVTRHGFTLFAWWRVIVGTLGLIALAMGR